MDLYILFNSKFRITSNEQISINLPIFHEIGHQFGHIIHGSNCDATLHIYVFHLINLLVKVVELATAKKIGTDCYILKMMKMH